MVNVDNATSTDLVFEVDVPSFIGDVRWRRGCTSDHTWSNGELNRTYVYADGPVRDRRDAKLSPRSTRASTLVVLVDDTVIPPGTTEMYYDISWMGDTEYYFSFYGPPTDGATT